MGKKKVVLPGHTNPTYKSYESEKEREAYSLENCGSNTSDTTCSDIIERDAETAGVRIKKRASGISFLGFPPHVILMLLVEFCERFSFYGIRSVLSVYLQNKLGFTQAESSQAYHLYIAICYITPILGGIIADQYWGKYKTILVLGIVYAIGNGVVSAGSIFDDSRFLIFSGLALISIGTGGIKPCISSFCGDQLDPSNEKKREQFFSVFYVCINVGALISSYMTPQWARPERHDGMNSSELVGCNGKNDCYPKAFGIPSILMFVALFLFVLGTKFYNIVKSKNDVFTRFIKTTIGINTNAGPEFKSDCRRVLRIFSFILPVTLFWAIFDQAGSTFTFQSAQLDKTMAGTFFEKIPMIGQSWILEDQVEAINPVIIVFMTPLFTLVVYPLINKIYKLTALRKIAIGMVINAVVCGYALYLQNMIDADFTYIFPENNPKSPIANATFVYQIDRPEGTDYERFAARNIIPKNFDVYDEYKLDQRNEVEQMFTTKSIENYKGLRDNQIYLQAYQNGVTSTRFWSWSNKLGLDSHRNDEAILHPDDFESRLDDKQHCSKAWKKDLPYVEVNDEVDYLMKPAALNKFIVFEDKSVGLMSFNITRPIQGRSRLDIISRKEFDRRGVLMCMNDKGFLNKDPFMNLNEFENSAEIVGENTRKGRFLLTLVDQGLKHYGYGGFEVSGVYGSGDGFIGVDSSTGCGCKGRSTDCNCNNRKKRSLEDSNKVPTDFPEKTEKSGKEKMEDSLKWHIPEHTDLTRISPLKDANIITHPEQNESDLFVVSYLIPQFSKCVFKNGTEHEIRDITIKTNGLYSITDFEPSSTNPARKWSKTVKEDVKHLKYSFSWQFVLYCISTASEIMISVSGLEYTYAQAPKSMKAVVSSLWLLPVFLGNMYDIYMGTVIAFKRHAFKIHKFNVYFSVFATFVFIWIANNYVTAEEEEKMNKKLKSEKAKKGDDDSILQTSILVEETTTKKLKK